jgi:hypothetical protein
VDPNTKGYLYGKEANLPGVYVKLGGEKHFGKDKGRYVTWILNNLN